MAAESGSQGPAVGLAALEQALREDPTEFGFFQAVRLLERLHPDRAGVGDFASPSDEVVRFSVHPSLAFPPSELHSLELAENEGARMSVNFMGLIGPQGVLPHTYSQLVAERKRARDAALADFFDIFHHRILSLFYRAWKKHRFTVAYEAGQDELLESHLLDLAGLGLEAWRGVLPIPDDALEFYAGLLAMQPRGAAALQQLLEDFFGVPVEIEQFVGGWYPLPGWDRCALGEEDGASNQLGRGAVVGDEIWDQQTRVRIRLGPLPRARYDEFLPTGSAYEPLCALARFFSHDQFAFEVQLILAREDVPGCVLGAADGAPQPLGWATWIRSAAFTRDADETILSL